MEAIAVGPGGKDSLSILSLYILTLVMMRRLSTEKEPTQEEILAEVTKDLASIFEGYEEFKRENTPEEAVLVQAQGEVI